MQNSYQSNLSGPPRRSPLRFILPLLLVFACLIVGFIIVVNLGGSEPAPAATPTVAPTAAAGRPAATAAPARPQPNAAPTEPALGVLTGSIPRETSLEASAVKPTATAVPTARPADTVGRSGLLMRNQKIYDLDGKLAYQGDVDLKPVLDRIAAGKKDPHANDGSIYTNRERTLPAKTDAKYYTEYVVRTQGIREVGPQRLIIGKGNEIYYTPDHYRTFVPVSR